MDTPSLVTTLLPCLLLSLILLHFVATTRLTRLTPSFRREVSSALSVFPLKTWVNYWLWSLYIGVYFFIYTCAMGLLINLSLSFLFVGPIYAIMVSSLGQTFVTFIQHASLASYTAVVEQSYTHKLNLFLPEYMGNPRFAAIILLKTRLVYGVCEALFVFNELYNALSSGSLCILFLIRLIVTLLHVQCAYLQNNNHWYYATAVHVLHNVFATLFMTYFQDSLFTKVQRNTFTKI